jgi:hypothetical protein
MQICIIGQLLHMKAATSAREIVGIMELALTRSPLRYVPVRDGPFVNLGGRTIIQFKRLCLMSSIACPAHHTKSRS